MDDKPRCRHAPFAATIIAIPAFWIAGFVSHVQYINDNYRQPAQTEWTAAEERGDLVAAQKAMHAREVADCRMGDMLYFLPFQGKCDQWAKSFAVYDAVATPESVKHDREMLQRAIIQGGR